MVNNYGQCLNNIVIHTFIPLNWIYVFSHYYRLDYMKQKRSKIFAKNSEKACIIVIF